MSFYSEESQALQRRFGLQTAADDFYKTQCHTEFSPSDRNLIKQATTFFLTTTDGHGHPVCAAKSSTPGLVRMIDRNALIIPYYDANEMFRSTGNIIKNPYIELLFIGAQGQHQILHINGIASVTDTTSLLNQFPDAQLIIRVTAFDIFQDCLRRHYHVVKAVA